jgi:hypothetical protein
MKTTRTVIISLFVMTALFFIFRSAEAAPGSPAAWLRGGESVSRITEEKPVEPVDQSPLVRQAPDLDTDLSVAVLDQPDPVLVTRNRDK